MIQKLKLVFHTVKYLKFRQIFNRLKRRYIKRAINISPSPSVSIISRKPQSFVPGQSRMLGENRFQFLNVPFLSFSFFGAKAKKPRVRPGGVRVARCNPPPPFRGPGVLDPTSILPISSISAHSAGPPIISPRNLIISIFHVFQ